MTEWPQARAGSILILQTDDTVCSSQSSCPVREHHPGFKASMYQIQLQFGIYCTHSVHVQFNYVFIWCHSMFGRDVELYSTSPGRMRWILWLDTEMDLVIGHFHVRVHLIRQWTPRDPLVIPLMPLMRKRRDPCLPLLVHFLFFLGLSPSTSLSWTLSVSCPHHVKRSTSLPQRAREEVFQRKRLR